MHCLPYWFLAVLLGHLCMHQMLRRAAVAMQFDIHFGSHVDSVAVFLRRGPARGDRGEAQQQE